MSSIVDRWNPSWNNRDNEKATQPKSFVAFLSLSLSLSSPCNSLPPHFFFFFRSSYPPTSHPLASSLPPSTELLGFLLSSWPVIFIVVDFGTDYFYTKNRTGFKRNFLYRPILISFGSFLFPFSFLDRIRRMNGEEEWYKLLMERENRRIFKYECLLKEYSDIKYV